MFESSNGLTALSGTCLKVLAASIDGPREWPVGGRPELAGASRSSIATVLVSENGDRDSENGDPVSISVMQLLHADCARLSRWPGWISSSESSVSYKNDDAL